MSSNNGKIVPTLEQTAVIESRSSRLVVVASAGAGKTGTLVHRYLRFVREGIRPDQILTITFTRKAAAEMKERIVKALVAEGLMDEAQVAETGPIQTIHAFCEKLLRENAIQAGLDPELEILSESASDRLVDECIQHALVESPIDCTYSEDLMSKLAGESRRDTTVPHAQLQKLIKDGLRLRGSGLEFDRLWKGYGDPDSVLFNWQRTLLSTLPPRVQEALREVEPSDNPMERVRSAFKLAGERTPKWLSAKVDQSIDRQAAEQACGLVSLVCTAWAALDQKMRHQQSLDFVALEELAVRLLETSEVVRGRLNDQYRVLMVDEAQDVNPIQYRLLNALSPDFSMLVGDAQQSIYGFRQADVRLFREQASLCETLRLTQNHRSDLGIQMFVDELFGRLWQEEYNPMLPPRKYDQFEVVDQPNLEGVEFWLERASDPYSVAQYTLELIESGVQPKQITVLVRGLPYGVQLLSALSLAGVKARIAGGSEKFYTRLEIRDLANALQSLSDPYDDLALLATLRSPFCGISIDTLTVLARQKPVVEALKSFTPPVEEDAGKISLFLAWFQQLSEYADRMPAWEVLAQVFAQSGYLEALARRRNGDQLVANVRKLLTLAAQEPDLGPAEYAKQIREIQNFRHREGDAPIENEEADIVTIMTIHKAKGLEFDVVIVPETHKKLEFSNDSLAAEPTLGMVVPRLDRTVSVYHSWVTELNRQKNVDEEHRILYVALTRAKKRLCVVVHPRAKQAASFSAIIARQLGLDKAVPTGALVRDSQDLLEPGE
jgi:ATP-dependent helicase/nuclease subunit A